MPGREQCRQTAVPGSCDLVTFREEETARPGLLFVVVVVVTSVLRLGSPVHRGYGGPLSLASRVTPATLALEEALFLVLLNDPDSY